MFKKKHLWTIIYSAVLLAFTVYLLLDTFVITRVYSAESISGGSLPYSFSTSDEGHSSTVSQGVPGGYLGSSSSGEGTAADSNTSAASGETTQTENTEARNDEIVPVVSEDSYTDSHISITLSEYREYDTTIYVADVQLDSLESLQSAFAQGLFGRNITAATSEIAEENGAILAINGDYYGSQEKGYVIRNGVLLRGTSAGREDLVIYYDGSFGIINEAEISAAELLEDGAWQVYSFGPALLVDGDIAVTESEEVGKAKASNPRTAIAIIDELHYLFIVSDGRTNESAGLSLYQLAQFIQSLGAESAYNLDGGGSSTMYFNGEVINNPTTNGNRVSERSVSDIIYIGY